MQFLLGKENSFSIPSWLIPRASRHSDSYVVRCPFISLLTDSLSSVVRWLGGIAEEKGVDVFSDTPVAGLLLQDNKAVGVVTQDKGLDAQGRPTDIYQRGYEIGGKSVLLAEGVLGSVTEEAIQRFGLQSPQQRTFGLGIKEVWEMSGCEAALGKVVHTVGYPLQRSFRDRMCRWGGGVTCRYGGGFVYFEQPNLVHVGYARSVIVDHR